jgi:hypothetical protein
LIVLVFDPLALVLILAADQTFEWHRPKRRDDWEQVWQPKSEAWPPYEPDFPDREEPKYEPDDAPLTDNQIDQIKQESGIDQTDTLKESDIPILEGEETQAQRLIDEEQAKNTTLTRELEAVRVTAENLKKKFVNFLRNPLKK